MRTAFLVRSFVNPYFFLASFPAHGGGAFFRFFKWLKVNDFSGTRRRKRDLDEAPFAFPAVARKESAPSPSNFPVRAPTSSTAALQRLPILFRAEI